MKNFILVIVIVAVAAYIFLVIKRNREAATPQYVEHSVALSPKKPEPQPEPKPAPVKYPVTPVEPAPQPAPASAPAPAPKPAPAPLPAVDKSDDAIFSALAELSGAIHWRDMFRPGVLVRRFVVTIDNMTAAKLPQKYRVTRPPPGRFQVQQIGKGEYTIAAGNYARYAGYVGLAEMVDLDGLVSLYRHFYPLFQQAYEDLGYPNRYFNDRLVGVIDHLLAAPDLQGPVQLKQPNVFYVFADPQLEGLSAGQKLMIRVGPENEARIKARLKELRKLLAGKTK